jgi:hypothetical protein
MKIIILVLSSENEPYDMLEKTIRKTWAKEYPKNVEIYYYYGGADINYIDGDKIYSNFEENIYNIGRKTINAFEFLSNKDYDYIFRTNSSSYVNIEYLLEYIKNKPNKMFYHGVIAYYEPENFNFVSGSGYIISKDLIDMVIENKDKWDNKFPNADDVSMGKILNSFGVIATSGMRYDIGDSTMRHNIANLTKKEFDNNYHFRCRCYDRNEDVLLMEKLNNIKNEK